MAYLTDNPNYQEEENERLNRMIDILYKNYSVQKSRVDTLVSDVKKLTSTVEQLLRWKAQLVQQISGL